MNCSSQEKKNGIPACAGMTVTGIVCQHRRKELSFPRKRESRLLVVEVGQ